MGVLHLPDAHPFPSMVPKEHPVTRCMSNALPARSRLARVFYWSDARGYASELVVLSD
jgi:hypothetical protein